LRNRISKKCPFCYGYTYVYKTSNGLIRHVMSMHSCGKKKNLVYPAIEDIAYVLRETPMGVTYVKVDSWQEVNDFLQDFVKDFKNPSVRYSRLWKFVNE